MRTLTDQGSRTHPNWCQRDGSTSHIALADMNSYIKKYEFIYPAPPDMNSYIKTYEFIYPVTYEFIHHTFKSMNSFLCHDIFRQPKWTNPIYGHGGSIYLKVGERIDIGGVLALVILAMVGINFAWYGRGRWCCSGSGPCCFLISKNPHSTRPMVHLIFSTVLLYSF